MNTNIPLSTNRGDFRLLPYKTMDPRRADGGATLLTAGDIEQYLRQVSPSPNYPFTVRHGKCRIYLLPGYTPWWKIVSVDGDAVDGERSFCGAPADWPLRDVIARGVAKAARGGTIVNRRDSLTVGEPGSPSNAAFADLSTIGDDGLGSAEPLPSDSFLAGLSEFADAFGVAKSNLQ